MNICNDNTSNDNVNVPCGGYVNSERLRHQTDKAIVLLESVLNTAEMINRAVKMLPRTQKHGRNIFTKTYNRRPMNKQKRALGFMHIGIAAALGTVRAISIASMPIPKYLPGTQTIPATPAIIYFDDNSNKV